MTATCAVILITTISVQSGEGANIHEADSELAKADRRCSSLRLQRTCLSVAVVVSVSIYAIGQIALPFLPVFLSVAARFAVMYFLLLPDCAAMLTACVVNVSYGFILNFNYNLAVANWRALNVAEKCAAKGKIANVGDEKFKKHIAELRALFAKNSEIADHMRVLEDIDDAIAAQEKVFLTARGVDAKTEVAICIKKLEERRDKYTRRRMNWKVAKALLDVNKAIELKGAKVGDVVLTLLFVRLLLDVAAPSIFKLKLSSGELSMAAKHLDDALKCFGVESSMVYECTKYGPVGVFPETYSPSPISIMPTARRFSGGHSARR